MGVVVSKGDNNTPLLNLCKERKELIKAARDARYHLAKTHVFYFRSLLEFSNTLNLFVQKDLNVIPYSSDDDSSTTDHICSGSVSDSDSDSLLDCLVCDRSKITPMCNNGGCGVNQSLTCNGSDFVPMRKNDQNQQKSISRDQNQQKSISRDQNQQKSISRDQNQQESMKKSRENCSDFVVNEFISSKIEDVTRDFGNSSSISLSRRFPPSQNQVQENAPIWDFLGLYNDTDYTQCDYMNISQEKEIESDEWREIREKEGIPELESVSDHYTLQKKQKKNVKQNSSTAKVTDETKKKDLKNVEENSSIAKVAGGAKKIDLKNVEENSSIAKVAGETKKIVSKNVEESSSNGEAVKEEIRNKNGFCKQEKVVSAMEDSEDEVSDLVSSSESCDSFLHQSNITDLKKIVDKIHCLTLKTVNSNEISELLEVNKVIHQPLGAQFKGFASRMFGNSKNVTDNSLNSSFRSLSLRGLGEESLKMKSSSLSITLEKLYMWEKKLLAEVTVEEKLRISYDKGYKILKDLDQKGAEQNKIDEAEAVVKLHLSEINVSVKSVESISMRVHKIRDEELFFEVTAIINGFKEMWRLLAKCHHKQFWEITRSKSCVHIIEPDDIKGNKNRSNLIKSTQKLQEQIRRYKESFLSYITAQRNFVEFLNEWLIRNIIDSANPEAPEIFRLCNQWWKKIEDLKESKVVKAIQELESRIHGVVVKLVEEDKQRMRLKKMCKELEKETKELQEIWGMNLFTETDDSRKMMIGQELMSLRDSVGEERLKHESVVRELNDAVSLSLQECLVSVFEALEEFCSGNVKAYGNIGGIVSTKDLLVC